MQKNEHEVRTQNIVQKILGTFVPLSWRVNKRRDESSGGRRFNTWWVEPASCVGGSDSPQSPGLQVGGDRLSPWSVGTHAVSQDCVRELSNAFQGDAGDALQMLHNLQK